MESYVIMGALCAVSLIVICTIFRSINKKRHNLHSQEYRVEIYNNTPPEYQESIRYLYNRLEQLDEIIDRSSKALNAQSAQAVNDVLKRASDAERKINEYWELNKRKADFYYYIGLHYTSFTLADKLTEELKMLIKVKGMLTKAINDTQSEIDSLKKKIENFKFAQNIVQTKRAHQELCRKCDALRKTRKTCEIQINDVKKRRDDQNNITRQRRDYIGTHFGKKGRQWRGRIIAKNKR